MNLPDLLAHYSRKAPDKEALISDTARLTFKEWNEKVNSFAATLQQHGIQQGSKVIIFMPNTHEFAIAYLAVMRIGALAIPINAKLQTEELSYIIHHSEAEVFIADKLLLDAATPLQTDFDLLWIKTGNDENKWYSFDHFLSNKNIKPNECMLKEDDKASILYTSGTTGKPKGVLFTYRSILTVARMMALETKMNRTSRILHLMPLSHSAPLHLFFAAGLVVGASHIVSPTFTPERLLTLTEQEKITHFFGAPVAYLLTGKQPNIHAFNLSTIEYWVYGGAPLSEQEVSFIKERFQTNQLMCVYGLTEAGPSGTYLSPEEHNTKAGSIGNEAAMHCELRIVDGKGNDVERGEVGEIILYGEGNMKEYYKDPEKTAATLQDGWLYTGDLARQDEDGYIWVVDRKKDMIISGGVNVYPKEVEDVLRTHPAIEDLAIIGVPHPEWGETVKAFVVSSIQSNKLEEECKRFLLGKLADYKIPRLYEGIQELPRNATGKILKQSLRKRGETHESIS